MNMSRKKFVKHIYLIMLVLIQVVGFKTVQGLKCVRCTDCKDDLSDKPTDCPTTETYSKCFTKIDTNGKIIRDCLKSTDESCTAENNCVATEDSKNNQIICKTCLGTDNNCTQTDASDSKYSKVCDVGISKCLKKLSDKLVVRGCASETDATQCTDKNTCETCGSSNCNTGIFPPNRLNCYQCSGEKCNDVTTNSIASKVCLLFDDKDQCYTKGESSTKMARGCKSDTKDNQCSADVEGCAFCDASGCNKLKYKGQPALKCYQCTGDSTNRDCYQNQTETNLKPCVEEILYNQKEYCFTQAEDGKIQRGCINDNKDLSADKCNDAEGGTCHKCSADGCNGANAEFTCITCRSDENTNCWNDATKIPEAKCRTEPSSAAQGCYHGIWNGVAIRGCTVDASQRDQEICKTKDNPNKCTICHEKNCNIKKSTGAKNGLSFALMAAALIQVTLWNFK